MITIHNVETGEIIVRDLNEAELAQIEDDQLKIEAKKLDLEVKAKARAALLDKLGLTEDEAKLLLS